MSRLNVPASIEAAPVASQPFLKAVEKQLGLVPNLYRLVSNSPAALEGFVAFGSALGKGALSTQTRERIALAIAEINGCDYCLSAHTFIGKNMAKLDDAEITANRSGASNDPKADAAVRFAAQVAKDRGQVSDGAVSTVKAAGYDDAQIVEIVAHVALNTLTNYINVVGKTEIDFPVIEHRRAA
jgi:uncharacterized peroxidase-related enzyme